MREYILMLFFLFYLIFTIRYALVFRNTIIFSGCLKTFHQIMIWLVPFFWILILQAISKSAPGTWQVEKKEDNKPLSDAYEPPRSNNNS